MRIQPNFLARGILLALPVLFLPACAEQQRSTSVAQTLAPPDPETERQWTVAIERVLYQEAVASVKAQTAINAKQPQLPAQECYIAEMRSIDLRDCPTDFRQAFTRNINAWQEINTYMETEMASSALDGLRIGALNALRGRLRTDLDGGYGRIMEGHRQKLLAQERTWGEIEVLGAKYKARPVAAQVAEAKAASVSNEPPMPIKKTVTVAPGKIQNLACEFAKPGRLYGSWNAKGLSANLQGAKDDTLVTFKLIGPNNETIQKLGHQRTGSFDIVITSPGRYNFILDNSGIIRMSERVVEIDAQFLAE